MKISYKGIIGVVIVSILIVGFGYFIWTQSVDGQIITRGFKLEQSGTTLDYLQWVKGYPSINCTDVNTLQNVAHDLGVNTIYSNMYHVTDYAGVLTYYFFSSNQTVYYIQYDVISDNPYPMINLWPLGIGIFMAALIIFGIMVIVAYKSALSTQQQSNDVKTMEK
jgi:hypothetical protein